MQCLADRKAIAGPSENWIAWHALFMPTPLDESPIQSSPFQFVYFEFQNEDPAAQGEPVQNARCPNDELAVRMDRWAKAASLVGGRQVSAFSRR